MFPFYLTNDGIGGPKREKPLNPEDLTKTVWEAAILSVRSDGDLIYKQTYEEYVATAALNQAVRPPWIHQARADKNKQQELRVRHLEEKLENAPKEAPDEYKYQNKEEA